MNAATKPKEPAKTDTQVSCKTPISLRSGKATASSQWFLESGNDHAAGPPFHDSALKYFICGEEAFQDIAIAIRAAKKSIDIICWGFDPAMELERKTHQWPRGDTWGGLLMDAARGLFNGGNPVQVRLLPWYSPAAAMRQHAYSPWGNNNMPGFKEASLNGLASAWLGALDSLMHGRPTRWSIVDDLNLQEKRQKANELWYGLARGGDLDTLSLRVRNGADGKAVGKNLQHVDPKASDDKEQKPTPVALDDIESLLIQGSATYHQKTVLIDYDDDSPNGKPVGYVMGLNSVTDYWDRRAHLFNDPKRGQGWEGAVPDKQASLKPYQDYACRIHGEALVMVAKNFKEAWNKASVLSPRKGASVNVNYACDPKNVPVHLKKSLGDSKATVQILRTEPAAQPAEQSIERFYYQTVNSARQYIYIENQYFQYAPWLKYLKQQRAAIWKFHGSCGVSSDQIPALHLFVVTPTPERGQMVPRTHDALTELGHGNSMPKQSKQAEDDLKRYRKEKALYDSAMAGQVKNPYNLPPPPRPVSSATRTYYESGGGKPDQAVQDDLKETMGLRCLVASLWTFDTEAPNQQRKALEKVQALENRAQKFQAQASTAGTDPSLVLQYRENAKLLANTAKERRDQLHTERYREIYIHSKLMLADDSVFTIGSANMNARSFYGDGEINMVTDCPKMSSGLRQEAWAMHSGGATDCDGGDGSAEKIAKSFIAWGKLIGDNGLALDNGKPIVGHLVPLLDKRTSSLRVG